MKKLSVFLSIFFLLTSIASAQVRINEVNHALDYIEICNFGAAPVLLTGYGLAYAEDTQAPVPIPFIFPAGTVISPEECIVITDDPLLGHPLVPAGTQLISYGANLLWNIGEPGSLLLFDNLGNGLDYYAHGNPNLFLAPLEGSSFLPGPPPPGTPTAFGAEASPLFGGPGGTALTNSLDVHFRHSRGDTDSAADYTMLADASDTPGVKNPFQELTDLDVTPPVPSFTASAVSGISPLTVTFTNTSAGDCTLSTAVWDFDATTFPGTLLGINHNEVVTYTTPMGTPPGGSVTFDVTLQLTDICGAMVTSAPMTITVIEPAPIIAQPTPGSPLPFFEDFEGATDPTTNTSMSPANGWEVRLLSPQSRVRTIDPATDANYVHTGAPFLGSDTAVVFDSATNSNVSVNEVIFHIDADEIFAQNGTGEFRVAMYLLENFDETGLADVIAVQDGFTAGNGIQSDGLTTGVPGVDGFEEVLLSSWNVPLGGTAGSRNWVDFQFTFDAAFFAANPTLAVPGSGAASDYRIIIRQTDNFMFNGNDGLVMDKFRLLNPAVPTPGESGDATATMDINNALNANFEIVDGITGGPFFAIAPAGGAMTFTFTGDPNQSVILFAGLGLNPAIATLPSGVGQFDIGVLPLVGGIPSGLAILANGDNSGIFDLFFNTDAAGQVIISFPLAPSTAPGLTFNLQAFLRTLASPFIRLTNAVNIQTTL